MYIKKLVHDYLQETICTVGEVFLSRVSGLERQPLLPQAAANDGLAGAELLFGPVPSGQTGQSDAKAWQVHTLPQCISLCGGWW